MVNITKDLFNFFFEDIFSDSLAGTEGYDHIITYIKLKYGKYIDINYDHERYIQKIKKRLKTNKI